MQLRFLGASGEVTGSAYLLTTSRAAVLFECGLFQGDRSADRKNRRFPKELDPAALDAVVLTHAHLDHSGRLPLLVKKGYTGRIFATRGTAELCDILLRDAAEIQETDARRETQHRARAGRPPVLPLYTTEDAHLALRQFSPLHDGQGHEVAPGITVACHEAGHILASASLSVRVEDGPRTVNLVLSGDIGDPGAPLVKDPDPPHNADVLLLESTYGDRDHRSRQETLDELAEIIGDAVRSRAKVLIPSFAIGRTQDLIYHLGRLMNSGRIPRTGVYIDSPMAHAATTLYRAHRDLMDDEARSMIRQGDAPLHFDGLNLVRSAQESMALNRVDEGIVIIAGAGMCTGGRILHHLKHNLWKPDVHLLFVGYQAHGTLGRRIVDGAKAVRIMGEPIAVKARIHTVGGLSAHAGQTTLVNWARAAVRRDADHTPRIYLVHGEDMPRRALAQRLERELGITPHLPITGDVIEL